MQSNNAIVRVPLFENLFLGLSLSKISFKKCSRSSVFAKKTNVENKLVYK
jgi:hypothetical protein